MDRVSRQEVEEAVRELHEYLSDRMAPLMASDSVGLLLRMPPDFMAGQVHAWISRQTLSAPVADYLFHAARKIALMGEFELVAREALSTYLTGLGTSLARYCPESDRQLLLDNVERLARTGVAVHAPVAAPDAPAAPAPTPQARRLSLILEHLRPLAAADAPEEHKTQVASRFMSEAAAQSKTAVEFDERLAPLRDLGIDTATAEVLRTLIKSLPGWVLPRAEGQPGPAPEKLGAIRHVVTLAEDPAEVARRFREMVHAAVEQFNQGNVGRAATMYELAERMVSEKAIQPVFVDALRQQGDEYLDADRLRRTAERAEMRAPLRAVLSFYERLRPAGLLAALDGEPKRERRHQLLALLEVHEGAARAAAWELLTASVAEGASVDPFFQMNLVYLLRIIPRPDSASLEEEVDVVMKVCGRSSPVPLVKQVIAFFSAARHDKSEKALMTYLKVFESMMLQPETAAYPAGDIETLLDRTCAALARYGTPRAWRLLIDHGLKSDSRLGATFGRLAEAGRLDLSSSPELVDRVIAAIRAELPRGGVLGFAARTNEDKILALVQALAATPLPAVRALFDELGTRFGDRRFGQAATRALAALTAPPAPASAGLTGNLELFGMPNLLQFVSQSQLTGVLTILAADATPRATLLFEEGGFRGGQHDKVVAEEAIYQLLERPFPGTFAFVSKPDLSQHKDLEPPQDVFALLMEGVRRHDEFQRAAALVPDDARLRRTGAARTDPDDEDPDFATFVWNELDRCGTASACEAALGTDPYRVRRLAAQWLEQGALAL